VTKNAGDIGDNEPATSGTSSREIRKSSSCRWEKSGPEIGDWTSWRGVTAGRDIGDCPTASLGQDEVETVVPGLATALQANPQRDIISAVDLETWVASLPDADQELLAMRQAGSTLTDIAEHLDVSISKVFSRMRSLGLILADRAGLPVAGTTPSVA
jgi:hypothetical protein